MATEKRLPKVMRFVPLRLAAYCRECDNSPATLEIAKQTMPCLLHRSARVDPDPLQTQFRVEHLLSMVQTLLHTESMELETLFLCALALVEQGFGKRVFVHSQTAER